MKPVFRPLALLGAIVLISSGTAWAQSTRNPPLGNEAVADVEARVQTLEDQIRQLTGQIEELRYKNGELSRQLQQLQDDLSLRVAALEQAAGGAPRPATPAPTSSAAPPAPSRSMQLGGSDDVPTNGFDSSAPMSRPTARQPDMTAPPLASAPTSPAPQAADSPATSGMVLRMDANGKLAPPDPNAPQTPAVTMPAPSAPAPRAAPNPPAVVAGGVGSGPAVAVDLPDGIPKVQYDYAFDYLKRQDYARAEAGFRQFLKLHPKDPLAGNAQYWLGESLYVRGDFQQAAVEFMNGYENYPKSNKGPDNLLKLGMSMANLNQTHGACTALARVAKEYPDASDDIRKSVQTERSKLKCA